METYPKCGQEIIFGALNGGLCSDGVHMELMAEAEERIYELNTVAVFRLGEPEPSGCEKLGVLSASCDLSEFWMGSDGIANLDKSQRDQIDWPKTLDFGMQRLIDELRGEAFNMGANAVLGLLISEQVEIVDGQRKDLLVASCIAARIDTSMM